MSFCSFSGIIRGFIMRIIPEKVRFFLSEALESRTSKLEKYVSHFLIVLAIAATAILILETTSLDDNYHWLFHGINYFVVTIFTIEYILRLLIHRNKLRYIFSFFSIVDLVIIISFYFFLLELPFLRLFRLFLIFRTFQESHLLRSFFATFRHYLPEIKIFFISFFTVLFISSLSLYDLEHTVNPKFESIPESLWWATVTVFTVGYGDAVPVTVGGKIMAAMVMFMGISVVAILTALVTKVFIDHFFGKRTHECKVCRYPHHDFDAKFCKNCGTELDTKALHHTMFESEVE